MHSVSIIGASGYSGAELTKLLLRHPGVKVEHLYAYSQAGRRFSDLYPSIPCDLVCEAYTGDTGSDVYFLALPHGEALGLLPDIARAGKFVIDLSGDFRLRHVSEHERFYKLTKPADAVLQYGMPELYRDNIRRATAISNPGCYATSIILGLAPLFLGKADDITVEDVYCTSASGISGAGRSSKTELSFSEMSENVRAYKVGLHQHTPEILQSLGTSADDAPFGFTFTPMIAPYVRGIYTVLNVKLHDSIRDASVSDLYRDFYATAPFVRLRESMTEVRHVAHTNFCDIHIAHVHEGSLVIVTAIDNLVKGAAGQAVQNMNLMLGYDERTALL
jgi:N-acetyl-gamma-glutamyl-phosphate reductase